MELMTLIPLPVVDVYIPGLHPLSLLVGSQEGAEGHRGGLEGAGWVVGVVHWELVVGGDSPHPNHPHNLEA